MHPSHASQQLSCAPPRSCMHAAFLVSNDHDRNFAVVAAGSGTKCLPGSKRSPRGDLVNDCHAEVLARRSLMTWLYGEAELAVQEASSSASPQQRQSSQKRSSCMRLDPATGLLELLPGLSFHMYVSQPPCGDCRCGEFSRGRHPAHTLCLAARSYQYTCNPCPRNQSFLTSLTAPSFQHHHSARGLAISRSNRGSSSSSSISRPARCRG